jgi:hypothetical protein
MEKLFSKKDIEEIECAARLNFDDYLDTYIITGENDSKRIISISITNQLIIVEGNEDTGFEHLRERHSFFSFKNYWKKSEKEEGVYKLDNPSKFNPQMIPIMDYVKIADTIFKKENKNITNNKRPDMFDKYTGIYNYSNMETEKYHLITYKDSKIIHSLFPDKKKYNKKNKTNYARGIVTSTTKIPEWFNDLLIPYENKAGIVAYSILFRKYYTEKIERLIIQKHDLNGVPIKEFILGYKIFEEFETFDKELMWEVQLTDLTYLEGFINQIDTKENGFM